MEQEIRWEKEVLVGPGRPCVSSRERGLCLQAVESVRVSVGSREGALGFRAMALVVMWWADWAEARLKVARFLSPDADGADLEQEGLSEFLSRRCHKNSYKLSITSHTPIASPAKFSH